MHSPVPENRLVAFTLAGAVLTAIVAGGLALPGSGLVDAGEEVGSAGQTGSDASQRAAGDAPTPDTDFTPAVQTQSGYEDEEHEDDDEGHEEGDEIEDEDDEHEADE